MSKFAVAFAFIAVVATTGCKKKGSTADTLPKETTVEPRDSGKHAAHDGDAGKGKISVDDDDGSGPSFGAVYFEFDSVTLTPEARASLQDVGDWMSTHPKATVTLEGHADARGTDEYNLALGQRRAQVMQDYLVRLGVTKGRLTTISYGEERPAASGDDEEAYALNRRGVLVPR